MSQTTEIPIVGEDAANEGPLLPRRKIAEDSEMDITPMIDITFLLLIYFLVAAHVDADAAIKLPPADYGVAVISKRAVILTVTGNGDSPVSVYRGDGKDDANLIEAKDLVEQEELIAKYVSEQTSGAEPKDNILIKAERGVKHRDVSRISRAAASAMANEGQLYVAVLEE